MKTAAALTLAAVLAFGGVGLAPSTAQAAPAATRAGLPGFSCDTGRVWRGHHWKKGRICHRIP